MILLGEESARLRRWLSDATLILEPLRLLAYTVPYEALLTSVQEVASLNRESSNQLLETLEEWNDYLER
jgi:hypothetical protein